MPYQSEYDACDPISIQCHSASSPGFPGKVAADFVQHQREQSDLCATSGLLADTPVFVVERPPFLVRVETAFFSLLLAMGRSVLYGFAEYGRGQCGLTEQDCPTVWVDEDLVRLLDIPQESDLP